MPAPDTASAPDPTTEQQLASLLGLDAEDTPDESPDSDTETPESPVSADEDAPEPEGEPEEDASAEAESAPAGPTLAGDDMVVEIDGLRVPISELKRGHLRQADYTRKTQKLAEERREVEGLKAERAQYAERLQAVETLLQSQMGNEPDWEQIKQADPQNYPARFADWQRQQRKLDTVRAEQQRVADQMVADQRVELQARRDAEETRLLDAIPDWQDSATRETDQKALVSYGTQSGFTLQELGNVVDHRAILLLRKAMLYDQLTAKTRPAAQAKAKAAPVLKPGTREPAKVKGTDLDKARQRLAKSGRTDDAAAVFYQLLDAEEASAQR